MADQVAEAGYIAVAPDLLSGMGPGGGKTSDFPNQDAAMQALYRLPPEQVTADLNAAADYAQKIPAANGVVSVSGFCWGGGQSFRFATNRKELAAAFVFYGPPPEESALANIACPVYGFYGGRDERINASIPATKQGMQAANKRYEAVIYEGAGHGFMRAGEAPDADAANKKGRDDAWARWKELLATLSR
jgi:carboxymethylenebutenolidase